jgi:uncharacterized iron-regulated membrane protein
MGHLSGISLCNTVIIISGVTSSLLGSSNNNRQKFYAFLAALAAEPFWLYASYTTGNFGISFLGVWYLAMHIRGVVLHWQFRRV